MSVEASSAQPSLEMASVLFCDIVGFSLNPIEKQEELLRKLQEIVRRTDQFKKAQGGNQLISLPTGDGMALVFFQDPVVPVKCAMEIQSALRVDPELRLRTGVHNGPVFRHADIKDNVNVVGGGINMAQRVMDCGDAGHILVSQSVAEVLEQLSEWPPYLHDLGVCEVKHGVRLHLYNVYNSKVGNAEVPAKVKGQHKPGKPEPRLPWKWLVAAGAVALSLIAFFVLYQRVNGPASNPQTVQGPQRTLRYYIEVQKYRDGKPYQQPFQLSGERIFEADYRIRIVLKNSEGGHLYVLNEGPKSTPDAPDLNTLFPSPTSQGGSSHLEPDQKIEIPQGGYFVFDRQSGKEKLWLIWTGGEIPELEALKRWANPTDRGTIRDSVEARALAALLSKYASQQATASVDEQNKMTVLRSGGEVLARLIQLEHD